MKQKAEEAKRAREEKCAKVKERKEELKLLEEEKNKRIREKIAAEEKKKTAAKPKRIPKKPLFSLKKPNGDKAAPNSKPKTKRRQAVELSPKAAPRKNSDDDVENYGIYDLSSADETDDEEIPKKTVPNWASGAHLEAALVCQFSQPPPDLEGIFGVVSEPDLNQIFPLQNGPFRDRTSSASWDSPFWNPRIGTATLPTTHVWFPFWFIRTVIK
ncbi:MAG: hypothetical protein GY822_32285 [Deltaproteobacteria bacterium]|nr:hypothetical protein [Deltaproteobacteria bacterium]